MTDIEDAQHLYDHYICRKLDMLIEADRLLQRPYFVQHYLNSRLRTPTLPAVKEAETLIREAHWFDEDITHLDSVIHNLKGLAD